MAVSQWMVGWNGTASLLAESVNHYYVSDLLPDFFRVIVEREKNIFPCGKGPEELYNLISVICWISPSLDAVFCSYCLQEVAVLEQEI